ncbi:unnamed protein product [Caenorhabditis auriculariae]|uniref:Receptor L-domain domain-containing protein n=1 Tax=Caenorhabditis auriculariae TaxID=2777116 RepID=A0A8S1HIN4_9PELO|nr:unnamed protein product [Caenorhabditis auriculariae]
MLRWFWIALLVFYWNGFLVVRSETVCQVKNYTTDSLPENCTKVVGLVQIIGSANPAKLEKILSTVEVIEGCVFISSTNLKNLNFLRNLKVVNCTFITVIQPGPIPAIFIEGNEKLLNFGIPNLKNVTMTPPPDTDLKESTISETSKPKDVSKLSKLKQLFGQIAIRDSTLEEIILPSLTLLANTNSAELPAIVLVRNVELKTIRFPKLTETRGESPYFDMLLSKNPSLNFSCEAVFPLDKTAVVIDESGFLCSNETSSISSNNACEIKNGTTESLPENCTKVIGLVKIVGPTNPVKLENLLKTVEVIEGCVMISNTTLVNLNFLRNLKAVNCTSVFVQQPEIVAAILVEGNPLLMTFGIPSLKNVTMTPPAGVNLDEALVGTVVFSENPKICLTYNEFNLVTSLPMISLRAVRMCPTPAPPLPFCHFPSPHGVDEACELFIGIVYIDASMKTEHVAKLTKMKQLYGQITISNSSIQEFILPNLTQLVNINSAQLPSMLIYRNNALKTVSFPKLTDIRGGGQSYDLLVAQNPSLNFSCSTVFPQNKKAIVLDETGIICSEKGTRPLLGPW